MPTLTPALAARRSEMPLYPHATRREHLCA